jgi:hypothetical protein
MLIHSRSGFAGRELGEDNALDIYTISSDTWSTVQPRPDPNNGIPGPRSVHGFVGLSNAHTPALAILFYGELEPSSTGHAGAGKFWDDIWVLASDPDHESGVSWFRIDSYSGLKPESCGWFPSASWVDSKDKSVIVLHGGLLSSNQRSIETYLLQIDIK